MYVAQDVKTGTEYALKRLIGADQQACQAINNEINVHRQLSGNGNIVTFIGSSAIAPSGQQGAQFLLLTELCKGEFNVRYHLYTLYKLSFLLIGGSLVDCFRVNNAPLDPPVVLRIFYQMARAVAHMHTQTPPIAHRDIKVGC